MNRRLFLEQTTQATALLLATTILPTQMQDDEDEPKSHKKHRKQDEKKQAKKPRKHDKDKVAKRTQQSTSVET